MKKSKTPQEKKHLSYKKDRRNTYGERGSHSRHAIALQKAINRRIDRRRADQPLKSLDSDTTDSLDQAELEVKTIVRRGWKKYPDRPLAEVVERKVERRKQGGRHITLEEYLKNMFGAD